MTDQPTDTNGSPSRVRNDLFDNRKGFDLGRPKLVFIVWYFLKCCFFLSPLPWPASFKTFLLRLFGAQVGRKVYWKPRINIHYPWKLTVGDYTWVGEEVEIYNFAPVKIGAHCCLSQRAFICAASHDFRDAAMSYRHQPITLGDGVWIGAGCFIGPGVTLGTDVVTSACSAVTKDLPAGMVCRGTPASRSNHDGSNREADESNHFHRASFCLRRFPKSRQLLKRRPLQHLHSISRPPEFRGNYI